MDWTYQLHVFGSCHHCQPRSLCVLKMRKMRMAALGKQGWSLDQVGHPEFVSGMVGARNVANLSHLVRQVS